jgi:hypothetical protein
MTKKALRPFPKFPGGRLPESAKPRFRKKDGSLILRHVRCGICGRNRAKACFYHLFGGRLHIGACYPCMACLPWSDTTEFLEQRLLERFAEMFSSEVAVQTKRKRR